MRLRIEVDGQDLSSVCNLESTTIQKQLDGRYPIASFDVTVGAEFARYGVSTYGNAVYSALNLPNQQSEVIIYEDVAGDSSDRKLFRGVVTSISREQKARDLQVWSVEATGLEFLLDSIAVNQSFVGSTDRTIIQTLFGATLPEITTLSSTVAELSVALTIEFKDTTLREVVERLSQLTGAEWRVSEAKELIYRAAGSEAAPFGFGDDPNGTTVREYRIKGRSRTSNQFANKVTVLGGFTGTGGAELRATAENLTSQTELGRIIQAIVVARDIDNQTALDLAAAIELEKRAVRESVQFETDEDGLEVGDLVTIADIGAGISGQFVIQSLSTRQRTPTDTVWIVSVGDFLGALEERQRQLNRIKTGPKLQPSPPPPPGSVGSGSLADGAVTRLKIAAQAVDTARLELAAVTPDILAAGAVTTTKIADNAISTPKLQAGSVVAATLAAGSVIAGKLAADSIVGSNIQAGTITAADAVFAALAVQSADIANAAITNAKIGNLAVATAQIQDLAVTNLKLANLAVTDAKIANATITSAKIVSLAADKIAAGTISASISITSPNITSTNGANIVNLSNGAITVQGAFGTAQLSSGQFLMNASAGSARLTLDSGGAQLRNSSGIQVGLLAFSVLGNQGNSGSVQLYNSSGTLRVNLGTDTSNNGVLGLAGLVGVVVQAGNSTTAGLYVNGQKVVGGRRPDPGASPTTEQLRQVLLAHGLI